MAEPITTVLIVGVGGAEVCGGCCWEVGGEASGEALGCDRDSVFGAEEDGGESGGDLVGECGWGDR